MLNVLDLESMHPQHFSFLDPDKIYGFKLGQNPKNIFAPNIQISKLLSNIYVSAKKIQICKSKRNVQDLDDQCFFSRNIKWCILIYIQALSEYIILHKRKLSFG